jgi:hypothetical protein
MEGSRNPLKRDQKGNDMETDEKKMITDSEERKFKNALEVTAYLQEQGWKVKRSSTYRHIQEGKLRPEKDGAFVEKAALRYAKNFLKRLDGTTLRRGERIQQDRAAAEEKKLSAQARHWEMRAKILEGGYVRRTDFESALAMRASIFKNDLESFCYSGAPEIIHLVNGDPLKVSDLIDAMKDKITDLLARYADPGGFTPLPLPNSDVDARIMENPEFSEMDAGDEDE